MSKRKRSELSKEDLTNRKISRKLHHGLKEVKKAAKKAKAFETRKLLKRLKSVRKDGKPSNEVSDLEAQLEILKHMNHEPIASTAFRTKLLKDHHVSRNPHLLSLLPSNIGTGEAAAPGSAEAKVRSRLLSSKVIASEVQAVIEDLKSVLAPTNEEEGNEEIRDDQTPTPVKQKKKKKKGHDETGKPNPKPSSRIKDVELDLDDEDGNGWLSGSDEDSKPEEDGWESGSILAADAAQDDAEDSDSASSSASSSSAPERLPKKKPITSSTFLPSLSVGFTRGTGSDGASDWEGDDDDESVVKKNRRGQRARRAIWEKKFGRNANHVKNPKDRFGMKGSTKGASATVYSQRRRAERANHQHKPTSSFDPGRKRTDSGWGVSNSDANAKKGGERLHPSWEAKRKMKEKVGIVPSQGTKITF